MKWIPLCVLVVAGIAAKNFGGEIRPSALVITFLLFFLFCWLVLAGPFVTYYYMQTHSRLKQCIACLSIFITSTISVLLVAEGSFHYTVIIFYLLNIISIWRFISGYQKRKAR